jgi:hypothetical protein
VVQSFATGFAVVFRPRELRLRLFPFLPDFLCKFRNEHHNKTDAMRPCRNFHPVASSSIYSAVRAGSRSRCTPREVQAWSCGLNSGLEPWPNNVQLKLVYADHRLNSSRLELCRGVYVRAYAGMACC